MAAVFQDLGGHVGRGTTSGGLVSSVTEEARGSVQGCGEGFFADDFSEAEVREFHGEVFVC